MSNDSHRVAAEDTHADLTTLAANLELILDQGQERTVPPQFLTDAKVFLDSWFYVIDATADQAAG